MTLGFQLKSPICRFCGSDKLHEFVDLGLSPLCQSQIAPQDLDKPEYFYPLNASVCEKCFLVQLREYVTPGDIFSEYAYFSSFSDSWVLHAKNYVEMVVEKFQLKLHSQVIEIASNDGYLLQHFIPKKIPVLGIEPAANVAKAAEAKGIESVVKFFGIQTATELKAQGKQADLLLGNNVLAHVPDLNDFVSGMKILLKPAGVITMEFPHLARLMAENQFDTIYHEHFSYFSFLTVEKIFAKHGLTLFDVEELPTHGGSLRIFARHVESQNQTVTPKLLALRESEMAAGFFSLEKYQPFGKQVRETKHKLLELLISIKQSGKSIAAYGAPGKGNTLLNYCGIRTDFIDFTVDKNPYKQGHYLPGSRIPILAPESIRENRPDYLLILPWNLRPEIMSQTNYIREWGAKWIIPIPVATVFE